MQKSFEDYLGLFGDTENNRQILITALEENAFDSFTSEQQETLYLKIIQELQEPLQRIPEKNRTSAISRAALQNDLEINLADVPDLLFQTEHPDHTYFIHQAENFIREQGKKIDLQQLPYSQRNLESCIKAVNRDHRQILHVPNLFLDRPEFDFAKKSLIDTYLKELSQTNKRKQSPELLLNEFFCQQLLEKNRLNYKILPSSLRNFNQLQLIANTGSQSIFLDCLSDKQTIKQLTEDELRSLLVIFIESETENNITDYFFRKLNQLDIKLNKPVIEAMLKSRGLLLEHLKHYFNAELTADELSELHSFAVQNDGMALKYIEESNKSEKICIDAALNTPASLIYLPKGLQTYEFYKNIISIDPFTVAGIVPSTVTETQLKELHILAIKEEPNTIVDIKINHINYDLIQYCLKNKFCFFNDFAAHPHFNEITLTDEQSLVLLNQTFNQDVIIIRYTPSKHLTKTHYETAAKRWGMTLEFFYKNENFLALDETTRLSIYSHAVKNSPMAIEFVPEIYRSGVIKEIGVHEIIRKDASALQFFTESDQEALDVKEQFKKVKHVIFTPITDEREVIDSIKTYSSHPKRLGKTIYFSQFESLMQLLDLTCNNPSEFTEPLNLVLIAHTNQNQAFICDLTPNDIAKIVENYPLIERITLLGCITAQAKPFDEEIEMAQRLPKIPTYEPCGLILMSSSPDPNQYDKYLEKTKTDKNSKKANEVLILEKNNTTYFLHHLKRDKNDINPKIQTTDVTLKFKKIQSVLAGAKQLPFPGSGKNPNYYRGGKAAEFLSPQQLTELRKILYVDTRCFERDHPSYQQHKLTLPLTQSHTVSESERAHLKDSLLSKVVTAIETTTSRSIEVKGYLQLMSADIIKGGFIASRQYLFTNQYKNTQSPTTFFQPDKGNINEKTLHDSRSTAILAQSEASLSETANSGFKAIIVRTNASLII